MLDTVPNRGTGYTGIPLMSARRDETHNKLQAFLQLLEFRIIGSVGIRWPCWTPFRTEAQQAPDPWPPARSVRVRLPVENRVVRARKGARPASRIGGYAFNRYVAYTGTDQLRGFIIHARKGARPASRIGGHALSRYVAYTLADVTHLKRAGAFTGRPDGPRCPPVRSASRIGGHAFSRYLSAPAGRRSLALASRPRPRV
jgi:hypothetical protein